MQAFMVVQGEKCNVVSGDLILIKSSLHFGGKEGRLRRGGGGWGLVLTSILSGKRVVKRQWKWWVFMPWVEFITDRQAFSIFPSFSSLHLIALSCLFSVIILFSWKSRDSLCSLLLGPTPKDFPYPLPLLLALLQNWPAYLHSIELALTCFLWREKETLIGTPGSEIEKERERQMIETERDKVLLKESIDFLTPTKAPLMKLTETSVPPSLSPAG